MDVSTIYTILYAKNPEYARMYSFCVASQKYPHLLPTDEHGKSPLHYAITFRIPEVLENYLSQGVYNVNAPDSVGDTPLIHALKLYDPLDPQITHAIVYLLLKYGANPNVGSTGSPTPLMLAVLKEDNALVQSLLIMGADPNERIQEDGLFFRANDTALSLAVRLDSLAGAKSTYTNAQLECILHILQKSRVSLSPNVLFHALQQTKHQQLKDYIMTAMTSKPRTPIIL